MMYHLTHLFTRMVLPTLICIYSLGIYFFFNFRWEDQDTSTLASATSCYMGGINSRPTFGRISWNIHHMKGVNLNDPIEFED